MTDGSQAAVPTTKHLELLDQLEMLFYGSENA